MISSVYKHIRRGIILKIRNELNTELFRQKTENIERAERFPAPQELETITSGDISRLNEVIFSGGLTLCSRKRILSQNELKNVKYHFVTAAAAIADACIADGLGPDEAYTIADIYCRKADKAEKCERVHTLFEQLCSDYTVRMGEIRKNNVISIHIRKCIDYIYGHLNADLSVRALAEYTGLSTSYLSRLFSRETDSTLKAFVTAARTDTAQNLLRYSELTGADIAVSLGYCSQSAFIYAFRRETGMTPQQYRQSHMSVK